MRNTIKLAVMAMLLFIAGHTVVFAVEPDEILSDPALEKRARAISANLRCVVCQNESIDSSNAGVARDLRLLVRKRLLQGDTDEQVYAFVVARYGDFVLLRPPWKATTYALWIVPFVLGILGAVAVIVILVNARRTSRKSSPELTDEELEAFEAIALIDKPTEK